MAEWVRLTNGTFEETGEVGKIEERCQNLRLLGLPGALATVELRRFCLDENHQIEDRLRILLVSAGLIVDDQVSDSIRNTVSCTVDESGTLIDPRDQEAPEILQYNPHIPSPERSKWFERQYDPVESITANTFEAYDGKLPVWTQDGSPLLQDGQPVHHGVERVVITLNGMLRDNENYGRNGVKAVESEKEKTFVISPAFLSPSDKRTPSERRVPSDAEEGFSLRQEFTPQHFRWKEAMGGWKHGWQALGPNPVSSFDLLDALVEHVVASGQFPDLKEIVIAGNSAGAQMGECYALVGKAQDIVKETNERNGADIGLGFVISNPTLHPYLTNLRPYPLDSEKMKAKFSSTELEEAETTFNSWPYGLDGPLPPYVAAALQRLPKEELIKRFLGETNLTLLIGREDTGAIGLRIDPPSMAQGEHRVERGERYAEHLRQVAEDMGIRLRVRQETIGEVGHAAPDIWKTWLGKKYLLGKQIRINTHGLDKNEIKGMLSAEGISVKKISNSNNYRLSSQDPILVSVLEKDIEDFRANNKAFPMSITREGNHLDIHNPGKGLEHILQTIQTRLRSH